MRTGEIIRVMLRVMVGWAAFSCTAFGNDPIEQVTRAIDRMDEIEPSQWAFVRTIQTSGQVLVARHDPRLEKTRHGWQLENVNGKPPSEKELAKFYQQVDQADAKSREDEDEAPVKISTLVRIESFRLAFSNEQGRATFEFTPAMNEGSTRKQDVLVGELVFDLTSQRVETISVRNTTTYSPVFSVKISTFDMQMKFEPIAGHVLLTEMSTHIQGKVFFKKIDEEVQVTFRDYEWVGEYGRIQ